MDIYEYLKKDHEKVANLFKQYKKSQTPQQQLEIFHMIKKELLLHSISEQETFYKALETHAESEKIAKHGEKEHREIQKLIFDLDKMPSPNQLFQTKIMALQNEVEHHVKEEEGEMFSLAKQVLSQEQAFELKEKMHDYKEKLLEKQYVENH